MTDTTVSVRVNTSVYNRMKLHDDINWSSIVRKSIIEKLEKLDSVDGERAKKAVHYISKIRIAKEFDKGRSGVAIIREWREKR